MYVYDKNIYNEWVAISSGKDKEKVYEKIKNDFKAKYVVTDKDHNSLKNSLMQDERFQKVYEDRFAAVLKLAD